MLQTPDACVAYIGLYMIGLLSPKHVQASTPHFIVPHAIPTALSSFYGKCVIWYSNSTNKDIVSFKSATRKVTQFEYSPSNKSAL